MTHTRALCRRDAPEQAHIEAACRDAVSVMGHHLGDLAVQQAGCRLLLTLARTNCLPCEPLGACDALCAAMTAHPESNQLQGNALVALNFLLHQRHPTLDDGTCAKMGAAGCCEAVVSAMRRLGSNSPYQPSAPCSSSSICASTKPTFSVSLTRRHQCCHCCHDRQPEYRVLANTRRRCYQRIGS